MAMVEGAEFTVAKALREKIFQIPLLPQDIIVGRFAEIDALLYPMAIELAIEIPAIRSYFKDIVHKIASGTTLGKNFFNKRDNEDNKDEKKKILKNSELRVLSQSFALLRHSDSPKKFAKILQKSDFMRGVMEEAVELFFDKVQNYEELKKNLAEAAANYSIEYIRFEQEMLSLLTDLGLDFDEQEKIDRIIPALSDKWATYLDMREEIIAPYYRKVYTQASESSQSDSQTLDNFQNGLFGLLRAYKQYTPSRFAAFALVAEQWIKQSILLHIKTEVNFIKLPIANWHSYQKFENIKREIEQKTNREASPEDIAAVAKMPVDKVKKIYEHVKLAKVLSLNVPTSNEDEQNEGAVWGIESVVDQNNIQDQLEREAEYQTVKKVVHHFDDEETVIFALISGCLDLVEIEDLSPEDVERERIRQIGAKHGIGITFK